MSGDPLGIRQHASSSKRPFEHSSRALFEDVVLLRAGANGLDTPLPVDEKVEKKAQADKARKMANGPPSHQQSTGPVPQLVGVQRQAAETQINKEGD